MSDDPYNPDILRFQRDLSDDIRKDKPAPPPDVFDPDALPFGKAPGANKINIKVCATCGKPPTSLAGTEHANFMPEGAFLFRDELSAREYYISGMCQKCQDDVFNAPEHDDSELDDDEPAF